MNHASNCFPTHAILQMWPPATLICSQTWRGDLRDRDFHQLNRSNGKPIALLEALQIVSRERHRNVERSLNQVYWAERRLCWRIKRIFAKKMFFLCHPTDFLNSLVCYKLTISSKWQNIPGGPSPVNGRRIHWLRNNMNKKSIKNV